MKKSKGIRLVLLGAAGLAMSSCDETPLPPQFIPPGDTLSGAALDVARTVVRRAERQVVKLAHDGDFDNPQALAYLNRLSSLLFILARYEDQQAGVTPLRAKQSSDINGM